LPQFAGRQIQASTASRNLWEGKFKRRLLLSICRKENSSVDCFSQFVGRKIQASSASRNLWQGKYKSQQDFEISA